MKFSTNSWHAKLFKLAYGSAKPLPSNLCPYFWKTIFSFILWPLLPFWLMGKLFLWLVKDDEIESNEDGLWGPVSGLGFLLYFALLIVASMIAMWWIPFNDKQYGYISMLGLIGYITVGGVGVATLRNYLKERRAARRRAMSVSDYYSAEDESNLFIEFFKATYKKYCPKINWK